MIEIFATTLNHETGELTVRFSETFQTAHGEHTITNSRQLDENRDIGKQDYTDEDVARVLAAKLNLTTSEIRTKPRTIFPVVETLEPIAE